MASVVAAVGQVLHTSFPSSSLPVPVTSSTQRVAPVSTLDLLSQLSWDTGRLQARPRISLGFVVKDTYLSWPTQLPGGYTWPVWSLHRVPRGDRTFRHKYGHCGTCVVGFVLGRGVRVLTSMLTSGLLVSYRGPRGAQTLRHKYGHSICRNQHI